MTFPVTGRVRRPLPSRVASEVLRVVGPSREMCEGCQWFQHVVSRCVHPRHGCTSGGHRIQPWTHPRACPVSRGIGV